MQPARIAAQHHRGCCHATVCPATSRWPARRTPLDNCAALPGESQHDLSSEFAKFMLQTGVPLRPVTKPSPLLPPHSVVAAQLDALQRNNYPEHDTGIHTAFSFAKPQELHAQQQSDSQLLPLPTGLHRGWGAAEQWLSLSEFAAQFAQPPFSVLVDCDSWKAASSVHFTGNRNSSSRAVQVVHVQAPSVLKGVQPSSRSSSDQAAGVALGTPDLRSYTFSFCLEQIQTGPAKGVWFTVGVRVGDYSV